MHKYLSKDKNVHAKHYHIATIMLNLMHNIPTRQEVLLSDAAQVHAKKVTSQLMKFSSIRASLGSKMKPKQSLVEIHN